MKAIKVLGASLLAAAVLAGNAQGREFGDIYMECGLGAMIFPTNNTMAAISNVTWDLGTTAVSSDASSADSCKGKVVAAADFINKSHASLETDLAVGEGQHLSALLNVMGCDAGSHAQISSSLRGDFAEAVRSTGYEGMNQFEKSETMFNMVNDRVAADYTGSCSV